MGFSVPKQISRIIHKFISKPQLLRQIYTLPSPTEETTPQNQRKIIEDEIQTLRHAGTEFLPRKIPEKFWTHLLTLPDKQKRLKFYKLLKDSEIRMENELNKPEIIQIESNLSEISKPADQNSIFWETSDETMDKIYNNNIYNAIQFGPKIIFDFGYQNVMDSREIGICYREFSEIFNFNKSNRQPFDLYFCNLLPGTELDEGLCSVIPQLRSEKCLVNLTEKSYLDLFPKEKLVYLTPHCDNDLESFDSDDIYVIGGLVTADLNEPYSITKSRKEGLRTAKLPLEKYLHWHSRKNALNIDQVFKILLTLNNTKCWYRALEHVPKRNGREFRYE